MKHKIFFAITLSALIFTAACSSLEPNRSTKYIGDRMWNRMNLMYSSNWKWWQKSIYWIGPGH